MAAQAACNVSLPDQPMDCCFHGSEPILASALVSGQLLMHRYTAQLTSSIPQQQQAEQQDGDVPSCSYSVQQVLCRDSKKGASCRAVVFSSDSSDLLCGFETGTILQLDPATGKARLRLTKAHNAGINRLLAVPDNPHLVAAGSDDGGICIWDLRSQQTAYKYSRHKDFISCLTLSDKHQALLAVSGDGTLSVHDVRSVKAIAHSETDADDELLSVAVMKNGKKVVCGSQSGVVAIWSWGYWNDCSDRFPGHPESVDAIVKWDENTVITGCSDGALRVINILPNKLLGVVGEHAGDLPVERLALSADKQLLASMSHDNCIKLWDMVILQDDSDADEDEDADEQQQEQPRTTGAQEQAAAAAAAGSDGLLHSQQRTLATAGDSSDHDTADSDAGSDGYDDDKQQHRRKRKRSEKTAMKGRADPSKGGNFFADLL